mmetsp:Transcript_11697/g.49234  ORF Transcript_11697/g.49234 Transcript_11697/m.49234 type:complete len:455 (+) Transcript_11697:899-2263(+)
MSADMAARRPSAPAIPTPTCATRSIPTSLAPSPMARQVQLTAAAAPRAMLATAAFCNGEARHTTAVGHLSTAAASASAPCSSPMICASTWPAMTTASPARAAARSAVTAPSEVEKDSRRVGSAAEHSSSASSRAAVLATATAVSTLSPVSIHTRTPAALRLRTVSGVPRCSSSLIPTTPTISTPAPIAARSARSSRPDASFSSAAFEARACSSAHSCVCSMESCRLARTRVRRPMRAKRRTASEAAWRLIELLPDSPASTASGRTASSAPFIKSSACTSASLLPFTVRSRPALRTITDMRLRSLSNACSPSTAYRESSCSTRDTVATPMPGRLSTTPRPSSHSTMATSSGDSPWKAPSAPVADPEVTAGGTTLLHKIITFSAAPPSTCSGAGCASSLPSQGPPSAVDSACHSPSVVQRACNDMLFAVSVPVLSARSTPTQPRSSFTVRVRTTQG